MLLGDENIDKSKSYFQKEKFEREPWNWVTNFQAYVRYEADM